MIAHPLPACGLDVDCELPARAVIGYARQPGTGLRTSLLIVPPEFAQGGIPGCVEHVHATVDGMLMAARGPAAPPSIETLPGADPQPGTPA